MKLNAFTYRSDNDAYSYQNQFEITNAPEDADWSRWAMLNDGSDYRLYCFKKGTNDILYAFAWDGTNYNYGHNSLPVIRINNIPKNTDTSIFSMLHDGRDYRLYLGNSDDKNSLHQFAWNGSEYNHLKYLDMNIEGLPENANKDNIAMLHAGSTYEYYSLNKTQTKLYKALYQSVDRVYEYSLCDIEIINIPPNTDLSSFSMAYGQGVFWLYALEKKENVNNLTDIKDTFEKLGSKISENSIF